MSPPPTAVFDAIDKGENPTAAFDELTQIALEPLMAQMEVKEMLLDALPIIGNLRVCPKAKRCNPYA